MRPAIRLQTRQAQVFRLGQVVSMLQMTTSELNAHLSEAARENPMLVLRRQSYAGAGDVIEMAAVAETHSLYGHVLGELSGLLAQGGMMERLVTALIEELEPSGWLGRPVAEIAASLGVSEDLMDQVVRLVQKRVDPAGLFARSLSECLRLQLDDRSRISPAMDKVLTHLSVLQSGGITALIRATGLTGAEVQACLAQLRRLDPKPGAAFAMDPALMREPDVVITPSADGWEIDFGARYPGAVELAQLPRGGQTPGTREAMARARTLKQALDIRQSACEQVVRALVKRQDGYFRHGIEALEPLGMAELATETGFHQSTVSRVLSGLLIQGPNGIVAARSLISGTAGSGSGHARPKVMARIRALLAAEDPARPISDRQLVAMLGREGITVSRRVVSKYRHEIGIASAGQRRVLG